MMEKTEKSLRANGRLRQHPLYDEAHTAASELLSFIQDSPTAWHAVKNVCDLLYENGFRRCSPDTLGSLREGDKGYFTINDSSVLIFRIGYGRFDKGYRVFGVHTDSPSLKIKPKALSIADSVVRLNTEVYGGPLLRTYFDRPLSLAGRVMLKGASPFTPKSCLVNLKKPILMLPSLAIHMQPAGGEEKIDRQKVLYPFLCGADEAGDDAFFEKLLAEELGVDPGEILDFELHTFEAEAPTFCGLDDCFISAGRLDNLSMLYAGVRGLLNTEGIGQGVQIVLATDNEEVGSQTRMGADSIRTRDLLESLALGLGASRSDFLASFEHSFMISADLAHAVHPNYPEAADPDHRPHINGGPVMKIAASKSYISDAASQAVFRSLAAKAGVPLQVFVNRSDRRGGSTIGPISSSYLPMPAVDVGNPIWGMHSIRETGGMMDPLYMEKVASAFFSEA